MKDLFILDSHNLDFPCLVYNELQYMSGNIEGAGLYPLWYVGSVVWIGMYSLGAENRAHLLLYLYRKLR